MRTLAMITRRLLGVAGLLALLTGIPTALLASYGLPDPNKVRPYLHWQAWADALTQPVSDSAITTALVIALWIVWARFTLAVLVQLPATLAGARAPRIRLLGPEQALAAFLFAAISLTPAAAASTGAPSLPAAAVSTSAVVTAPPQHVVTHAATALSLAVRTTTLPTDTAAVRGDAGLPRFAAAGYDGPLTVRVAGHDRTVTVAKHDTLWDLAERYLDDPSRWREIYQLNRDHYDENGRMHGGNHIEAGWRLHLPDDAAIGGTAPHNPNEDPAKNQKPATPAPSGQTPSTSPPGTASPSAPSTPIPNTRAPSTPATPAPDASAPRSGDDGVAEPTTAGTPTGPAGSATTPGGAASPAENTPRPGSRAPTGIDLPTGGWIDLGLAAAILTAVALIWAHRRRRYTHRPATPRLRLREGDTTALPPTVTHLRRGLRRRAHHVQGNAERQPGTAPEDRPVVRLTTGNPANEGTIAPITDLTPVNIGRHNQDEDNDDEGEDYESDHDDEDDDVYGGTIDDQLVGTDQTTGTVVEDDAVPVSPALAHPVAGLWPPAGLGLTGAGAEAAARGFLTAALATGGVEDPHTRGRVVMSSNTCATLLGAGAVSLPTSPRLIITAGLSEALSLLEEHTLHRTRLVFDGEVDTLAALRDVDPFIDPLPPIVLIADASALHERARVAALLTQGQRLDIHGILLGAWPDGDTVEVADDGSTTAPAGDVVRHGSHPADIGRLSVLTPAQTTDLLQVLTEAHTGEPQPPAPTETPATESAADTDDANDIDNTTPVGTSAAVAVGHSGEADTGHNEKKTQPSPSEALATTAAASPSEAPAADHSPQREPVPATTEPTEQPGRVSVSLFGTPNLLDRPIRPVFRLKAMELLAYLAVQDAPIHRDFVLEDVLGDTQRGKAQMHLNTFVFNVRQVCKVTGGSGTYVLREKDYFSLDGDAFDLDVWQLRDALTQAQATTDPAGRIAALRRAVDAYTGEFAEGCDYDWAEPYRQALRNQALDAALDLTQALTATGEHDQATQVLQTAITLHPYAEQLYQQAMRAHAARGDLTAVRTLRRTLTQHLAEIDAQPSDETVALADQLVATVQAQTPHRRSSRPVEET